MHEQYDITVIPETVVVPELEETKELRTGEVVNCARLNVRAMPNGNAKIVCTVSKGAEVLVEEDESVGDFYKVFTVSGIEGFCMKQYVAIRD